MQGFLGVGEEVGRVEHVRRTDEGRTGRVRAVEMEAGCDESALVALRHLLALIWLLPVLQWKIGGGDV